MRDVVLFCVMVALFVIGSVLMKKLDRFLDRTRESVPDGSAEEERLIAVEDRECMEALEEAERVIRQRQPDSRISFYYGPAGKLRRYMETESSDCGLLIFDSAAGRQDAGR